MLLREECGIRDTEVNVREYLAHNSRVQPIARESEELLLTDVSTQPHCVVGNEVRNLVNLVGMHVQMTKNSQY